MVKCNKGISLIELVVVIALVSLILTLVYMIFLSGLNDFRMEYSNVDNQFIVRQSMSFVIREIRRADIVKVNNGQLRLTFHIGDEKKTAEYRVNPENDTLYQVVNGVWEPLAVGIKRFEIIDKSNEEVIFFEIIIESLPDTAGKTFTLSSNIVVRE